MTLPVKDFISDASAAAEAEELIVENLQRFNIGSSGNVLIACNTAHILLPTLKHRTGIQFNSLIDTIQKEVQRRGIKKIGILASPTSLERNVHNLEGVEVIRPSNSEGLGELIRETVNGIRTNEQIDFLKSETTRMLEAGAEAILLGCAELEMLLAHEHDVRFIRPLKLTIRNMMQDKSNEI